MSSSRQERSSRRDSRSKKKAWVKWAIIVISLAGVGVAVWLWWTYFSRSDDAPKPGVQAPAPSQPTAPSPFSQPTGDAPTPAPSQSAAPSPDPGVQAPAPSQPTAPSPFSQPTGDAPTPAPSQSAAPSPDPGPCFAEFLKDGAFSDNVKGAFFFDDPIWANCTADDMDRDVVCDWSSSSYYTALQDVCVNQLGGRFMADDVIFCKEDLDPDFWFLFPFPRNLDWKNMPFCLPQSCGDEITALDLYAAISREGAFVDGSVPSSRRFTSLDQTLTGKCSFGDFCYLCGSADVAVTTPQNALGKIPCDHGLSATAFVRSNEGKTCASFYDELEDFPRPGQLFFQILCGCENVDISSAPDVCGYGCGEGKVINPAGSLIFLSEEDNCYSVMAKILFKQSDISCAAYESAVTKAAVQEACCIDAA